MAAQRTSRRWLLRAAEAKQRTGGGRGLKWLAAHQMPDGGWTLAHGMAPNCRNQCRNPGERTKARVAATGLALLPFLGAGQTHKAGQYKKEVRAGLYYLVSQMKVSPQGGSLVDQGNMYSHGIGAIVLCEAYAMTHDKGLYTPAQQAVNFICYAQDPVGGGWRYQPRQKGDTSVVGWQIMALKSGHMAYLRIPPITIKTPPTSTRSRPTAGQLRYTDPAPARRRRPSACCAACTWAGSTTPRAGKGRQVDRQAKPSKTNMYYNYYATQVMPLGRRGVEEVERGDADMLVKSQATKGHEAGSWCTEGGDHSQKSGGRLYCTAMATMILEVYYRHLPIYRKQSTDEIPARLTRRLAPSFEPRLGHAAGRVCFLGNRGVDFHHLSSGRDSGECRMTKTNDEGMTKTE